MKFKINTETLLNAVKPASEIALRNTKKKFRHEKNITIKASIKALNITAYGGTASITIKVTEADGYAFMESGGITVRAKELQSALMSFSLSDNLFVTIEGCYVKMTLESDNQIYISIPASTELIEFPYRSLKFKQQTIVDRKYFIKGLEKIKFAPAFEEKMFCYMCVLFESWNNRIRFSAGTGARFASTDYSGDIKSISTNETRIILPKTNISNLATIFKNTDCSTIKIKSTNTIELICSQDQVVLEAENITVALYDIEHFAKYPDMDQKIKHNYSYQIPTWISDWKYALEAIIASKHFFKNNIHNARIIANLMLGHFDLTTNTEMKMNRRVDFDFGVFVKDSIIDKGHKPWFCCNSDYLREMVKVADKGDIVVINFDDQSILDTIPDDKPKQMSPILLKYPEKTNKDGVKENLHLYFLVSNKWFILEG